MIYKDWLIDIQNKEIPIVEQFTVNGVLSDDVEIAVYVK